MKKSIISAISALSILVLISCGTGKDNASIEPNDSIDKSNTIALNTEFSMAIYPEGDVDWYEVEVPGQGYLQVLTRDVPDNLTPVARLATYDEWGERKENWLTSEIRTPCAMQVFEEGTYFVRISDVTRVYPRESEEEFYVKFNFIEEFDQHEPNNKPEEAVEAQFGKEYESAIFPKGNEDWFKVNVEEQGYLQVQARNVPDELDLQVYFAVYDEYARNPIKVIKDKDNLPTAIAVTEPGEYYVVFVDRRDRNESRDFFTWKVNFIPEMDKYEPNDCFTKASQIGLNDTLQIAVFPRGDKNFFKIVPEKPGNLRVLSSGHGDLDLTVALYSLNPNDPSRLIEHKSKTRIPTDLNIDEAKEYFIKISDRLHRNSSPELFDVVLKFE